MKQIVFVTRNFFKEREIKSFLYANDDQLNILSLKDIIFPYTIKENGFSFQENALIKAKFFFQKTHIPCFSEDSGLRIECLNGAPGIYSSRYFQKENSLEKLLLNIKKTSSRKAELVCVFCLKINKEKNYLFEGKLTGYISEKIMGKKGFGYDPIFIPDKHKNTLSQINILQKNKISHRIKAFKKLMKFMNHHL
ncbi:RdgB/HAM1 family non-canonical purine NTP pyrophosphatase [Blattabacterium cuenoti]|uniref:RdgB/HAM1 family non-canonical purine NTP pyrophosphatase n=1 Tax=Blattabacterium cuenoti TaxID=1653831 RepID=UPI00163CB690|nr:RdgB/HAM1 family non-canonical purine NTP pyrophosphatase [Blattabacterium cuenoti]